MLLDYEAVIKFLENPSCWDLNWVSTIQSTRHMRALQQGAAMALRVDHIFSGLPEPWNDGV